MTLDDAIVNVEDYLAGSVTMIRRDTLLVLLNTAHQARTMRLLVEEVCASQSSLLDKYSEVYSAAQTAAKKSSNILGVIGG